MSDLDKNPSTLNLNIRIMVDILSVFTRLIRGVLLILALVLTSLSRAHAGDLEGSVVVGGSPSSGTNMVLALGIIGKDARTNETTRFNCTGIFFTDYAGQGYVLTAYHCVKTAMNLSERQIFVKTDDSCSVQPNNQQYPVEPSFTNCSVLGEDGICLLKLKAAFPGRESILSRTSPCSSKCYAEESLNDIFIPLNGDAVMMMGYSPNSRYSLLDVNPVKLVGDFDWPFPNDKCPLLAGRGRTFITPWNLRFQGCDLPPSQSGFPEAPPLECAFTSGGDSGGPIYLEKRGLRLAGVHLKGGIWRRKDPSSGNYQFRATGEFTDLCQPQHRQLLRKVLDPKSQYRTLDYCYTKPRLEFRTLLGAIGTPASEESYETIPVPGFGKVTVEYFLDKPYNGTKVTDSNDNYIDNDELVSETFVKYDVRYPFNQTVAPKAVPYKPLRFTASMDPEQVSIVKAAQCPKNPEAVEIKFLKWASPKGSDGGLCPCLEPATSKVCSLDASLNKPLPNSDKVYIHCMAYYEVSKPTTGCETTQPSPSQQNPPPYQPTRGR